MMNNLFQQQHWLYPFRWFIVIIAGLVIWEAYADFTGARVLSFSGQEHWKSTGSGGHSGHK